MFSDVHNGVGQTQKIIKDRRGGHRTSHHILFRIRGGDTAQENDLRCSQWGEANAENSKIEGGDTAQRGGDTAHNTTYYQNQGGGHRTRKCSQKFTMGWGRRRRFKDRGGTPHKNQSRLLGGWLAGWLGK